MAKEEKEQYSGYVSSSSGGSDKAGSSAKASSGSSAGKTASPSSGSSDSKPVSKAGSIVRDAIAAGARHATAKSGWEPSSGSGDSGAQQTDYSRSGSGFTHDNLSAKDQTRVDVKAQVRNDELSYLAAATNALANKMFSGEPFDENSYSAEAFAMANQINQGWKNGVGQAAVVKDGKVVVEADRDIAGNEHYWYSLGEDGKKVATQNPVHRKENLEMLNNDIQRWTNFANSGNFTRADVINESAAVKQWINAMDDGLVENFQMEDGTTARDYLQSLFDGRESLLTAADRQTAIRDYNALAAKYTDAQSGLAQGALYGNVNSLITDRETLQNYAAKYADDEELGAAFGNLAAGYYDLYNFARRQEYDHLSAKVDRLDEEFTKAELYESDLKDMVVAGEAEDPGAYERAKSETKKASDAYKAAKAELAAWTPNTSERRDELIAKMHANAGFMRGGLTEEEQKELLDLDAQLFNPDIDYGKDFTRRGAAAVNILKQGAAGIARTGSSALNFVVNGVPKVFNGVADWLVDHSDFARDVDALASELFRPAKETAEWFETGIGGQQEKYAEEGYANISGDKVAEFFNKYGPEAIQMIPMAMVAYATGGGAAGGMLAGDTIAATSQMAQATGLEQLGLMVGNSLKTTASDPNFQTAFLQELGGNYNEAIEDGASDSEAVAYALLCSFLNSEIEIGGGIQDMPESMRDAVSSGKKDVLLAYAKSMVEEGLEEVQQGAVGSTLKGMYQPTEIFSTTDQNAIINPLRAVEEFKGGAIGAAFLGAPTTAVNTIRAPGVKGALTVDEQGRVVSALSAGAKKGANRHETSTGVLAEGFEDKGYVNSTNADEDFRKATTGAEGPRTDAEANQQSYDQMIEEEAERQAEAEEARKAEETQEAKRKEDAELEKQARIREQEAEGARRAAQAFQDEQNAQLEAAQEAEKYAQLAHNAREFQAEQDFIRKAQQARQAAEEAGRKAEEQLAFAESQSRTLEGQETPVAPAPANQDEVDQGIAGSQAATLKGQESTPKPAPRADPTTASETAQGEEEGSTPPETPESAKPPVKLEGNERGEVSGAVATAEQGMAAIESGETNNKTVAEVIPMVDKHVSESEPISTVAQNVFESRGSGKTPLSDRVANWIKSKFPAGVHSKAINGNVIVDKRGIKNDIAHGVGEAKAATFAAVPDVLDKGTVVSRSDGSVKDRSVTIAGKVMLNGSPVNVYCVVKQNSGDNRFYLHEVSDGNGTIFYKLGQNNNATPALLDSTGANPVSADVASTASIAQNPQAGKADYATWVSEREQRQQQYWDERFGEDFDPEVEDAKAIAQNPQAGTNSSTNVQADGTIEAKGVNRDGTRPELHRVAGNQGQGQQVQPGGEQTVSGDAREVYRPSFSGNEREIREQNETWDEEVNDRLANGDQFLPEDRQPESLKRVIQWAKKAGVENVTIFYNDNAGSSGITFRNYPSVGIFVTVGNRGNAGRVIVHETVHNLLQRAANRNVEGFNSERLLRLTFQYANVDDSVLDAAYDRTRGIYAPIYYPDYFDENTTFINGEAFDENGVLIENVPDDIYDSLHWDVSEELLCELISNSNKWFDTDDGVHDLTALSKQAREVLVGAVFDSPDFVRRAGSEGKGIAEAFELTPDIFYGLEDMLDSVDEEFHEWDFSEPVLSEQVQNEPSNSNISETEETLRQENEALKQRVAELEAAQQEQVQQEPAPTQEETQETSQGTGRTPGVTGVKSMSALSQATETKGERNARETNIGETDYISRTNEARSRTADALTEDPDPQVAQQKKDAQVQRLLKEDYVWNDDDVVIAQKVMFDMIKAIRDYQMKKTSRMKPEAFRKMTEQYNKLMDKHIKTLSESGQKLQANYMFSTGDKIVMRAAQTFLGFTKDGRFAGASVNAKNAKIYAGIEEAAKRIQAAVDSEDVQGLAKICKDISDIRNVKKMFGPLGGYASEMESRVLDKIAKGENAAKNLENLAYGNLNAVCDDVQPYKALNAAKTIRVMNMLSNAATGVNNLANNFAQGAVNRSRVNQAFSGIAAKPFAALTGQEVLSQTARGKDARQAVRNAKMEALETATLMQMYGITEENGRLELNDRGMFNPNINPFEQTMSLYKFLTGMGVEATDKMQAAGMLKEMELGIDRDIKAGKIEAHTREQRMQEARHEVNRLLYKDDNSTTALVQHVRDFLNKWSIGNDRVGTIGVGDITMAFAKIPANVVRARLAMTPEGALLQVAQYAKGVNKAKRMHAEVLARGIVESYQEQIDAANTALQSAYEMEHGPAKDAAIQKAKSELSRLNSKMWTEAQSACRGSVYKNLRTIAGNYNENMMFNEAVERAGYMNAKEMSQFEAAQLSRKIGRAAMSAGMMALGSVLRAAGALRDFDQEPDDELRKMNSDKGYRGLMMNLSAIGRKNHEWKDGDLIIDGEFLEVIAMPLTIGATAAEAAATAQDAKTWSWLKSMAGNGIAKTFEAVGDIPGMADAINMYESLTSAYTTDYDEKVSRLGAGLLQYAANTVPSFFMPNSISQAAAGFDNKVRDVYAADTPWGQAVNIFKNKFPGLRNTIPVSVDVWGNERTYGETRLWGAVNKMLLPGDVHVYRKNKYETEIERMVRAGYGNATPKTTVNSSFEVGDEKYTMSTQEKLDFKAARNTQQRELFEAFIDSDYYKQLDDAERMKVFQSLKTSAERDAKQDMLNGRQLDVEVTRDKWETELTDVNDQIQFLAAKQMAGRVWDTNENAISDYAAMDSFIANEYDSLNDTQKEILVNSFSRLDDLADARKAGINSEKWQAAHNIYSYFTRKDEEGHQIEQSNLVSASDMWAQIQKATGFSDAGKEMKYLQENMKLTYVGTVNTENYDELIYDYGVSRESAAKVYSAFETLTPTKGYANVQDRQKWKALPSTGLSDKEQWDTFFALVPSNNTNQIRNMTNLRGKMNPRTLKPYTFAEATHELGLDTVYWKEVLSNGREKKHELK